MSADWYESFAKLAASEVEGVDYQISVHARRDDVLILAPHGGHIEPGTSTVARVIAADSLSLYLFEGLREDRKHRELHITSRNFDEPRAIAMVGKAHRIVAVHGRRNRDDSDAVWLGGLDMETRSKVCAHLAKADFQARNPGDGLYALDPMNICNRSLSGKGIQLELPRGLRDLLVRDAARMSDFASAIRAAIM